MQVLFVCIEIITIFVQKLIFKQINDKEMTTIEIKNKAKIVYEKFKSMNRLNVNEIQKSINEVNRNLRYELHFSKDLRNVSDIQLFFKSRLYFKELHKLISVK